MSRTHVAAVLAAVAGMVVLTACGRVTEGAPVGIAFAAAQREVPAVTLNAVEVDGLGTVLTDQDGMTLYRFDRDTADPPTSNCDGDCAATWPPVLGTAEDVLVAGLDRDLVGSITRVDGDSQVTVGGWPLYRFAKDREPGEARGQGVGGAWYGVTPDGRRAGAVPVALTGTTLPRFGAALTDQDGFTLYLFTRDSADPPVPTCYDACARLWPPVLAQGAGPELTGVDPAIVGEVERTDGTRQVTVGGWPVYRYSGDPGPGRTTGHGVDGTWFVIEPAGCRSPVPTG